MLNWAVTFFVIAIVAALLGLGGIAGISAELGRTLAVLGIAVLVVGLVARALSGRSPTLID